MADLSPVETLRQGAAEAALGDTLPEQLRAPIAEWLANTANNHAAVESIDEGRGECVVATVSPDFKRRTSARHILPALRVARVLLGVPDGV